MESITFKEVRAMYRKLRKKQITTQDWWSFIEPIKERDEQHLLHEVFSAELKYQIRLNNYINSRYFKMKIRKFCNFHGYSDIRPFEVIRIISPRKVEIREMEATMVKPPVMHTGGFSANTENDTQEWEIQSNDSFEPKIITLVKKGWGNGQYKMNSEPQKFYDYNF